MGINAVIAVNFVGVGVPEFIPPTNNLNKRAPTKYNALLGGAGFYRLSVRGKIGG